MKRLLSAIVFTSCSVFAFAQTARSIADSIRIKRRIPALMYAVVSTDSILEMGGVGYKQFKVKDTIDVTNRFHLGSATVSITSFIAYQLVAEKQLVWTTRFLSIFPELAGKCRPEYKTITFGELLAHRAGLLPVNTKEEFYNLPVFNKDDPKTKQRISFTKWVIQQKRDKRDTSDSRIFRFSNANTAVAVTMMERVTGKSWEDLLQQYVNKPLGINIKTDWPIRLSETEPMGHLKESGVNYISLNRHYWFRIIPAFTGACDANITIKDYARFIQDQLRGLRGRKALLPPNAYSIMHTAYPEYGFGWFNFEVKNYHISECDGTLGSFYTHVEIVKEKNLAVIVFCNSGDNDGKGAAINLAKKLRELHVRL
jgi:CubicO group peptidase (beta-lactamase class C family)